LSEIDLTQYPETVEAFGGDEHRATVFLDRYAAKGPDGKPVETLPDQMFGRVSAAIGEDEGSIQDYYDLLRDFKFVPGGRINAGAGVDAEVTFYNCYVIPVETKARRHNRTIEPVYVETGVESPDGMVMEFVAEPATMPWPDPGNDSREAIFDTMQLMVDIMSRGGGVGINWSVLRPKGAYLKRVNGTSSGPVGWMDVASKAVGEVEQGGSRRGAAMFMIDDWHPDVEQFITAKWDGTKITNANVSVAVSDAFMDAVNQDAEWPLVFPDTSHAAYNSEWDGDLNSWMVKGYPIKGYRVVRARELWDLIATAAWGSNDGSRSGGEPGVIFLDRYNKASTGKSVERIICVNPCGEQGLGAYSVCNLGSMNLQAYILGPETVVPTKSRIKRVIVNESDTVTGNSFNYDAFRADVKQAVRFMDAVIDKNYYFIPENEAIQKKLRRIGLGAMGLADALISVGMRYGSPEAVAFTEAVYRVMKDTAIETSRELAVQKGAAPGWDDSMLDEPYLAEYLARKPHMREIIAKTGLRNLFLLTQAPTGTTSILAGVNSGLEPLFALEWTRKDRTGKHRIMAPAVKRYREGKKFNQLPDYFMTADEVTVEEHIAMQAAAQKYVDSSISKTINAPHEQTVDEVKRAYQMAYDAGLKGVAYFRDRSGRDQVLTRDSDDAPETDGAQKVITELQEQNAELIKQLVEAQRSEAEWERPEALTGRTIKVATKSEAAYVTINRDEGGVPREVFFNIGKSGDDVTAMAEALGRLASLALRKGATLGGVANQLEGIGGMSNIAWSKSIPHAIGQALTAENKREADEATHKELQRALEAHFDQDQSDDILPWDDDEDESVDEPEVVPGATQCPSCREIALVLEEGCKKCFNCSYSAC
jgi:ribonucleoside-diphosphate reductase alpha chain